MVTQTTIDTINYIKDIEIEYNMKLIFIGVLFLYSLVGLYFSFKVKGDKLWSFLFKWIGMRFLTIPFLILTPFLLMLLVRDASLTVILGIVFLIYSVLMTIFTLLFLLFGAEKMLEYFGIESIPKLLNLKVGGKNK